MLSIHYKILCYKHFQSDRLSRKMKAVVLLMIAKLLVYRGLSEGITLSLCSNGSNGTINWMYNINGWYDTEIEFCSSISGCYKSTVPMTFNGTKNENNTCQSCNNTTGCYSCNISYILKNFDECTCSQQPPTCSQDCSTCNNGLSTKFTQDILITLLALLAVLLVIVTAGWVCTCWAMHKSRKREMNINTTNIR